MNVLPVEIKLQSSILDCSAPGEEDPQGEQIRANYHGTLTETEREFRLSYTEDAKHEMGNTKTVLVFPKEQADLCMMVREGSVNCTMSFSQSNPRHFCDYRTPFGPFSFTVVTKKMNRQMGAKGGKFFVEYDLEIRGVVSQHNKLGILVVPMENREANDG